MRFVRFHTGRGPRWGRVEEGGVHELAGAPWQNGAETGQTYPLDALTLLAPYEGTKIICIGRNYAEHAAEFGNTAPPEPMFFLKAPSALVPPGGTVVLPDLDHRIDFEAELVAVVGRTASRVAEAAALGHIFGYTIGNDISDRDLQKKDLPFGFGRAKNFDTFCPLGPWVVTGLDPANLPISLRQNGEARQEATTALMVHPVPKLISFLSQIMTLQPGDLILTGTPAGVGPLRPGDRVEVTVEGIGTLRHSVTAPS
jgi:2-keto-4-pentenoate hydratase/2-oxohepta-3-ene-1,7-dioic acid hydratase in catechol pathway